MAYYKNLTDPKKAKKHYTYGAEEGTRYSRKENEKRSDTAGKTKAKADAAGRYGATGKQTVKTRKNPPARRPDHDSHRTDDVPARRSRHDKSISGIAAPSYSDFEYKETPVSQAPENHEETDRYILTGRNPIREALKNHRDLEKLLVQKGELSGSAMEIVQKAKEQRVMVQVVEKSRLDEIAPQHQGLIAFASAYQYATVEEILSVAGEKEEDPFIIILDGITDPHNLGAIIRTAECAGVHGVIVPQHRSVGLTPAAVKASAGAVEYVKVARVTNLNRTIEELQKQNIWVYALDMDGTDYMQVRFDGGTALVIGAEGEGISRLTGMKCDMKVALPMKGQLDSLNASVAAGIMMYRVMNCRYQK